MARNGRYDVPPLYYLNHESRHSIMYDTWEPFALTSMPKNREVTLWIGGNDNEMYALDGPIDCEHDVGTLFLTIIFFYFIGSMYLQ